MEFTNHVLKNRAQPLRFRDPDRNRLLAEAMLGVMKRANGIGLAAPQLGISKRLFVMCIDGRDFCCFNPQILESDRQQCQMVEGCLSFPGEQCTITRPSKIAVKYQDHRGLWQQHVMEDILARCFQHELDHLDGITMWDRYKEQHAEQS